MRAGDKVSFKKDKKKGLHHPTLANRLPVVTAGIITYNKSLRSLTFDLDSGNYGLPMETMGSHLRLKHLSQLQDFFTENGYATRAATHTIGSGDLEKEITCLIPVEE